MPQRETKTRTPAVIPDKLYFRIGDVAKICGVETYVLRFWETEFPQLKPGKSGTGQRLYRRKEVELALRIKTMLHDKGYTIAGARQAFKDERVIAAAGQAELAFGRNRADRQKLDRLRSEMTSLIAMLNGDIVAPTRKSAARRVPSRESVSKVSTPELF